MKDGRTQRPGELCAKARLFGEEQWPETKLTQDAASMGKTRQLKPSCGAKRDAESGMPPWLGLFWDEGTVS